MHSQKEYKEKITCVETLKTESGAKILAIGGQNSLSIYNYEHEKKNIEDGLYYSCNITNEVTENQKISTEGLRIDSLRFTIKNNHPILSVIKNDISCSVYEISDSKVQNLFTRNSDHILPINSCCFIGNDKIATASDDHTCCVISIETQEVLYSFRFQSNVVSISSNPNSKNSMIISEENGVNHYYDLSTGKNDLKWTTKIKNSKPTFPLYDSEWNPYNQDLFGAVAEKDYFIYDLRKPDSCLFHQLAHTSITTKFRWSKGTEFATSNFYNEIGIHDPGRNLTKILKQTNQIGGITWTDTDPSVCITGGEKKINFWSVVQMVN